MAARPNPLTPDPSSSPGEQEPQEMLPRLYPSLLEGVSPSFESFSDNCSLSFFCSRAEGIINGVITLFITLLGFLTMLSHTMGIRTAPGI